MILRCEQQINPVGVNLTPDFSWIITDEQGSFQESYSIAVFDTTGTIVWNSGNVTSSDTCHISYKGSKLKSHTRYFWNVTVTTDAGCFKSDNGTFVTGIDECDMHGKWITGKTSTAPLFKRSFTYRKKSQEAFASICGLGFFELVINSKKVGKDYFVPARTDYNEVKYINLQYPFNGSTKKSLNYLTYNVTDYLTDGENTVEILLGNGMYCQAERTTEGIFDYGELKLLFQLSSDSFELVSDESWTVHNSKILYNNLFIGEKSDLGAECTSVGNATAASSPDSKLLPQLTPPDRVQKKISPIKLKNGIYDCGEVLTGLVRISAQGKKGAEITISYAEKLDANGELDYKSTVGYDDCDKNQIQRDTVILSGNGIEVYSPTFTWHGFRYFKIKSDDAVILEISALYIHSDVKESGSFECSDALLNNIHRLFVNAQKTNLHCGIPMDCPHRERLGYTGDGQNSSYSVMYNFSAYNFYKKWLYDILDAQNPQNGFVPHTAPFNGGGGGPGWGSAIAIVAWNLYLHYGDKKLLKKAVPGIKSWILYLLSRLDENGLVSKEEDGSWCLGDWCLPTDGEWDKPKELKLPNNLVNTFFLVYCIKIYQKSLLILSIAEYNFSDEYTNAVKSINRQYLNSYYAEGVQGANVFPLYADIVPDEKLVSVKNNLLQIIKSNNYCVDTGLFGTRYLFDVLDKIGRNDIAYKIMSQTAYPSYGYMVSGGATASLETWEGTGSQTHLALTGPDYWFYNSLAGIKPDECEGFKSFTINPCYEKSIDYVTASYTTVYGDIVLSWKRSADSIVLGIEVPFNTTCKIKTNNKYIKLTRGKYKFEIMS